MISPPRSRPSRAVEDSSKKPSRSRSSSPYEKLKIPKNRSTGSLLNTSANASAKSNEHARVRVSFDAANMDHEHMTRSGILPDHEHGPGANGLRRIRQQPPSRSPTNPPSLESSFCIGPSRSSSMYDSASARPSMSNIPPSGPSSPTLNYVEDLKRFPSESLHSFSFAQQSEDLLHNRQNILKRSIDFMRDKLGWAASNAALANAQAKLSGDADVQSMMELLARANFFAQESGQLKGLGLTAGPATGPADIDGMNIFDKSFGGRSESPDEILSDHDSDSEHDPLEPRAGERASEDGVISPDQSKSSDARIPIPDDKRPGLKRTYTDLHSMSLQNKLMEALARPFSTDEYSNNPLVSPPMNTSDSFLTQSTTSTQPTIPSLSSVAPTVHGAHSNRWSPVAQAIFATEAKSPWTITSANDLACLVFGVTKAEVRKMGILEVVQEDRRAWLEEKLRAPGPQEEAGKSKFDSRSQRNSPTTSTPLAVGNGVTAKLLSKPSSREAKRRAQTDDGYGSSLTKKKSPKGGLNHAPNKSRGVLLCGDVVPIQKRNGGTGSASFWVKEKRIGLIWVLEEIVENVVDIQLNEEDNITDITGDVEPIWGDSSDLKLPSYITKLVPAIPRKDVDGKERINWDELIKTRFYTAKNRSGINIPITLSRAPDSGRLRLSSFPHIAGILVLSPESLTITSSNSVFSSALFGYTQVDGMSITELIPGFDRILQVLTQEDEVRLVDGLVIPEHSFRRARAVLALREKRENATSIFLRPSGLIAQHRDGSKIMVDAQIRVVKSESPMTQVDENVIEEESDEDNRTAISKTINSEVVYALWITYSRHLHSPNTNTNTPSNQLPGPRSPPYVPSPGQTTPSITPIHLEADSNHSDSHISLLTQQIKEATSQPISSGPMDKQKPIPSQASNGPIMKEEPKVKKTISDFVILEDMGQGAYGQVKLARYKKNITKKVVLKYVTKKRILVDTWTRDRRLGTVPLEIHVLDYLRRDGLKHANIVEMTDFFEDNINYYIEMVPHGIPGMDLFDYIELRTNMEEDECKSIFRQVVGAIYHLHSKALVVHRDIKDENVVLDGEGKIKLIDFGSAAYIKNGPFDVFVGTIDYAAPEVLQGKSYRGKEQDIWALGILLYTIVYKENPFYSIDEIMDHELRIPFVTSPECIRLIQQMLDRDVDRRLTIQEVMDHPWLSQ
ncbi:MAG: hypothetical protein M1834_000888 [Cirrosporium novae-zelandiae]|nr:MAG: hypothetical protein M1834_000888 [Cirrosporium novae-zelandiae]